MSIKSKLVLGGSLVLGLGCNHHQTVGPATLQESDSGADLQSMIDVNFFKGPATVYEDFSKEGGGCGPTEKMIQEDTLRQTGGILAYAALNVANTPHDWSSDPVRRAQRGPHGEDLQRTALLGMYKGGSNCGRWIEVTLPWQGQSHKANFIVSDSCYDSNGWCRDYPGHVDLSIYQVVYSITGQRMDQTVRGRGWPINWPNSGVTWKFIPSPNYQGPIRVYFAKGAHPYWNALIVSNLKNGLGGVHVKGESGWVDARMDSDRGQVYLLPGQSSNTFEIRIKDSGASNWNDEVYRFKMPAVCSEKDANGNYRGCPEIMQAEGFQVL